MKKVARAPAARENLEHGRRPLRVRAVVEGERRPVGPGEHPRQAQRAGGLGRRGRERAGPLLGMIAERAVVSSSHRSCNVPPMSAPRRSAVGGPVPAAMPPDLDRWLPDPALRVAHRRESSATAERLWAAAQAVTARRHRVLGRLVRWRIPGTPARAVVRASCSATRRSSSLDEASTPSSAASSGRIWTLRRDYPRLDDPEEFRAMVDRAAPLACHVRQLGRAGGSAGGARSISESPRRADRCPGPDRARGRAPVDRRFQNLVGTRRDRGRGAAGRAARSADICPLRLCRLL